MRCLAHVFNESSKFEVATSKLAGNDSESLVSEEGTALDQELAYRSECGVKAGIWGVRNSLITRESLD
jgi:hypothetical protein